MLVDRLVSRQTSAAANQIAEGSVDGLLFGRHAAMRDQIAQAAFDQVRERIVADDGLRGDVLKLKRRRCVVCPAAAATAATTSRRSFRSSCVPAPTAILIERPVAFRQSDRPEIIGTVSPSRIVDRLFAGTQ